MPWFTTIRKYDTGMIYRGGEREREGGEKEREGKRRRAKERETNREYINTAYIYVHREAHVLRPLRESERESDPPHLFSFVPVTCLSFSLQFSLSLSLSLCFFPFCWWAKLKGQDWWWKERRHDLFFSFRCLIKPMHDLTVRSCVRAFVHLCVRFTVT